MGAAELDDSVFVSERICIACEAGFLDSQEAYFAFYRYFQQDR